MRQMEPEEFQCMRGTVFDRERSGPAGLNAARADGWTIRRCASSRKSRSADAPPKDKLTPEALGTW